MKKSALKWLWLPVVLVIFASGYVGTHWAQLTIWPKKRAALVDGLRDPASAQFREERLQSDGYLCGQVNAKNGMGGYTGFQRFASYERGYVIEGQAVIAWPNDDAATAADIRMISAEANWRKTIEKPMDESTINAKMFDAIWAKACR